MRLLTLFATGILLLTNTGCSALKAAGSQFYDSLVNPPTHIVTCLYDIGKWIVSLALPLLGPLIGIDL